MKMNKKMNAKNLLIGVGISAVAAYAVVPAVKSIASSMSNSKMMSNNSNNNSTV